MPYVVRICLLKFCWLRLENPVQCCCGDRLCSACFTQSYTPENLFALVSYTEYFLKVQYRSAVEIDFVVRVSHKVSHFTPENLLALIILNIIFECPVKCNCGDRLWSTCFHTK